MGSDDVAWLTAHATSKNQQKAQLKLVQRITGRNGRAVQFGANDFVVNGGPWLIRSGEVHVNAKADGVSHEDNPSAYYTWGMRRHPRTMAGIDTVTKKLLLVQADGRNAGTSEGLSLIEGAKVMKALGATETINFDGGGSSTMVTCTKPGATSICAPVNRPSDTSASGGDHAEDIPRPVVRWR